MVLASPSHRGTVVQATPPSIGVAVLLANWTNLGGEDYAGAATAQIEYLFWPVGAEDPRRSHLASRYGFAALVRCPLAACCLVA
jgi:hypothetical protein